MRPPIRIVIADDHQLFREGLKSLLKQEPQVAIVGETDRADAVTALLEQTPCDLLLLDLQMERSSLADIEALAPRIPIIVLTASDAPADALSAMRQGARAVVFKRFALETLMDAIETVTRGHVWMPPSLQTQVVARLRDSPAQMLSPREEEVVRCVAAGLRNAEVAKKLSVSEQTVKTHLNSIFRKLGVRDRLQLTLFATRSGITGTNRRP